MGTFEIMSTLSTHDLHRKEDIHAFLGIVAASDSLTPPAPARSQPSQQPSVRLESHGVSPSLKRIYINIVPKVHNFLIEENRNKNSCS